MLEKTVESSFLNAAGLSDLKRQTDALLSNLESSLLSSGGGGVDGIRSSVSAFEKNRSLQLSSLSDAVKLAQTSLTIAKSGKSVS